jgi:hypothetical protein
MDLIKKKRQSYLYLKYLFSFFSYSQIVFLKIFNLFLVLN